MAMWEIALAILALLGVLWTLAAALIAVPLFSRLRRAAERADNLLREAELQLGPALADLREMSRHLNKASAGLADGVAQAGRTFEAVGDLGKTLHGANAVLRTALGPGVTVVASLLAGLRSASRVLLRHLFRRR